MFTLDDPAVFFLLILGFTIVVSLIVGITDNGEWCGEEDPHFRGDK